MKLDLFNMVVLGWMALAVLTFISLFFVTAPYGRHARKGWGPEIPARLSWILMECPSPLIFGALFFVGHHHGAASIAFLSMWLLHYVHRAFIYPFTLSNPRPVPASITLFGAGFNLVNASLNGYFLFFVQDYPAAWLTDPRFLIGAGLFAVGFVVNRWSDSLLRKQRTSGGAGYVIPKGGPWNLVASPNYLGEIIEWCGWAMLTWSLAGASFAIWTIANLAPRALSNHRWYRKTFPDYPASRKALVPFLW